VIELDHRKASKLAERGRLAAEALVVRHADQ
jgi:hypothetical protein